MKKKTSKVPVFLIYAGIIHAIGLALLMPMLITLPGPGGSVISPPAAIDVEIVPASPLAAKIESDSEQTSALPSAEEAAAVKADDEAEAVANVSPTLRLRWNRSPPRRSLRRGLKWRLRELPPPRPRRGPSKSRWFSAAGRPSPR